ncbi:hypothetical protein JQC67_00300 [Aurantibacter crassamenti]|uniref:hypothetical protein n=1 Tax=Aurantibacter crassamenti TaxID=1837375 RepID=UPI00193A78F2|nr:hypothetical protein [Aurantibacter crassamenti]MBM1104565.1 hypothetical protein [Aurantibacter crassamenti]
MKYSFLLFFFSCVLLVQGQTENSLENVVITSKENKTKVRSTKNGELHVNVAPKDVIKLKAQGTVQYSDFGAIGDGKTDAIDAIAATHAFANKNGLKVKADEGATYYISGKERSAIIQTDTDFGTSKFIIDDTEVVNRRTPVFIVSSTLQAYKLEGLKTLQKNQNKIDIKFPQSSLITVTNSNVKHYIRYGLNQDKGANQTDIFVVDKNGNVDVDTPIIWDFNQITDATALPMDQTTLKITGGRFTTIANKDESKYNYYARNIVVKRSNVVIDGIEHRIKGEGENGAPYHGFINTRDCANITLRNALLTGHKTYKTIGSAGKPVSMGSYDISINRTLNASFINCRQTNDINDNTYWGIFSSNYSKNLLFDNCIFSRFDAHKGVANATIRNSILGHMGINAIGTGTFTLENSTVKGRSLINLRSDYGSTWQGEIIIRNSIFIPRPDKTTNASLFSGSYSGMHDFGYTCYMPERIIIENLKIDDSEQPEINKGITIFKDFNKQMIDDSFQEKYPYIITKEVVLKNVNTTSGKKLKISSNEFMFKGVAIKTE